MTAAARRRRRRTAAGRHRRGRGRTGRPRRAGGPRRTGGAGGAVRRPGRVQGAHGVVRAVARVQDEFVNRTRRARFAGNVGKSVSGTDCAVVHPLVVATPSRVGGEESGTVFAAVLIDLQKAPPNARKRVVVVVPRAPTHQLPNGLPNCRIAVFFLFVLGIKGSPAPVEARVSMELHLQKCNKLLAACQL